MQTIRSFIAIPLSPTLRQNCGRLIERLAEAMPEVKWLLPENLHLTLKFLGEVDNRLVPEICELVRETCADTPVFTLQLRGVSAFPDLPRARVIWARPIQGQQVLEPLADRLEQRLADLGFRPEGRSYRAHLTLGRLPNGRRPTDELFAAIEREAGRDLGSMRVEEVQLIASYLDRFGTTYSVMDRVAL
jgi:2'-5' RNA ligase